MSKRVKILRTDLILSITCKGCGELYYASLLYGGIAINEEEMMYIARAHNNGDTVKLSVGDVKLGYCNCEESKGKPTDEQ